MGLLDRIRSAVAGSSLRRAGGERTLQQGSGRRVADLYDAPEWMWVANPDFTTDLAIYAYREWFSTAIDRVAEMCVSVPMVVRESEGFGRRGDHPLLALLGTYGQANRHQDSFEFLESHFRRMDIYGNDVWYWVSHEGGAPDEVYQLDLRSLTIRVIDGVQWYIYDVGGTEFPISPDQVTHFKRANVVASGAFWGLSAIDKLKNVANTDMYMTQFQQQFFRTGAPSGILIVDLDDVSSEQARQIEAEFHGSADEGRRLAVIRAKAGSAVWNEAAAKQRDMDFEKGRLLTRQAAFDALGFHVGAVSESSTEAHARVAEALVRESAWTRHRRTASALNGVLGFWPASRRLRVDFEDVRATDWERESKKLAAVTPFMTINEVRSEYLGLGPISDGDQFARIGGRSERESVS